MSCTCAYRTRGMRGGGERACVLIRVHVYYIYIADNIGDNINHLLMRIGHEIIIIIIIVRRAFENCHRPPRNAIDHTAAISISADRTLL